MNESSWDFKCKNKTNKRQLSTPHQSVSSFVSPKWTLSSAIEPLLGAWYYRNAKLIPYQKIDFRSKKKNVIVVIGIDWNCKHCFGSLESPTHIDRFCFILFLSWLMKFLVFFYSFESLTWIFSGTWIENLGCINSEKLGRPALDIFQTNKRITVSLSPRKTLFWIKITKSLFFASVH